MKSKVLVWVVVCPLFACSGSLMAKERRGADLLITKTDGQQVKGELIAVKPTSLLLLDSQSGADVSAGVEGIAAIKIIKKSKALLLGGIGFAVGIAVGVISETSTSYEWDVTVGQGLGILFLYGAIGAIPGLLIGATIGADQIIQIEGKSDTDIKEIWEKLRRQARVPDAQ